MKIRDILNEFIDDMPTGIRVKGQDITVSDLKDLANWMQLSPAETLDMLKDVHSLSSQKVGIPFTDKQYKVADLIGKGLDVASLIPLVKGATKGVKATVKAVDKSAKRQVGSQLAKSVADVSISEPNIPKDSSPPLTRKRKKFNIGDLITIKVKNEKFKVPVIGTNNSGYVVDVSSIPGKNRGETATIPDTEISESSSATVTSGNIASLGNSPHVAAGTPAVLKRWSGEPGSSGTTGKSVKHKPMKKQTASDNPITNPNVGNNLIA